MSDDAKNVRDLALDQYNRTHTKLSEAISHNNERKVKAYSEDLTKDKDAAVHRHLQYLNKAKKALSDATEKLWLDEVNNKYYNLKEKADDFLHAANEQRESEAAATKLAHLKRTILQVFNNKIGEITKSVNEFITALESDTDTLPELEDYTQEDKFNQTKLIAAIQELEDSVAKITDIETRDEILKSKSDEEFNVRKLLKRLRVTAREKGLQVPNSTSSHSRIVSPEPSLSTDAVVKPKKFDFPKFNGDILKYSLFVRRFNEIVCASGYSESNMAHILCTECLTGEPKNLVQNIVDYKAIWDRLDDAYNDPQRVVEIISRQIEQFKKVKEKDYNQFVKLVDTIERGYIDLTAVEKSNMMDHPTTIRIIEQRCPDWILIALNSKRSEATGESKDGFAFLLEFLKTKRKEARKLSQTVPIPPEAGKKQRKEEKVHLTKAKQTPNSSIQWKCFVPGCSDNNRHFLTKCSTFKNLDCNGVGKVILEKKLCVLCFSSKHDITSCPRKQQWKTCDVQDNGGQPCNKWHSRRLHGAQVPGLVLTTQTPKKGEEKVILLTQQLTLQSNHTCQVLWDHGSTTALVTNKFAEKLGLDGVECTLTLTVAAGNTNNFPTKLYLIRLPDNAGKLHQIFAYGIDKITSDIDSSDLAVAQNLFPQLTGHKLQQAQGEIDLLIGMNYANLLPTQVSINDNLALYTSLFGTGFVVGGKIGSTLSNLDSFAGIVTTNSTFFIKTPDFITAEGLGVDTKRRCKACGSCKECSFKSTSLSWQENKELELIENGLVLDTKQKKWICSYPYKEDPSVLHDNFVQAKALMYNLEKRLTRLGKIDQFNEQFQDAVDREVFQAVKTDYNGPINYISIVDAYKNGPHCTTPLRLCMNSSLKFAGKSLNDILYKGPSALNDLYGLALRFRKHKIGFVRDLSKFYQSVLASERDQHVRRVIWRWGKTDAEPEIYKTTTVNFGDRPAGCVAQVALRKTARIYKEVHPLAAEVIENDTYSDDTASGGDTKEEVIDIVHGMDDIVSMGGFRYKDVIMSGDVTEGEPRKVLGIGWNTEKDSLFVDVKVNFHEKKKGVFVGPDADLNNIQPAVPEIVTKRMIWRVVMAQYDALGLIGVFLVRLKLIMRDLSNVDGRKIGWDDPIEDGVKTEFLSLLQMLNRAKALQFPRSLTPLEKTDDMKPDLVVMVDGSQKASCCLAYIRWTFPNNQVKCSLISGKTRVAPIKKLTVPRMELQSAVLGVRLAEKIIEYSGFSFEQRFFITDSTAVLGMIRGDCSTFVEFVANRVSEIRSKTETDEWQWIPTQDNLADYGTRPTVTPEDMDENSEYQNGKGWMYLQKSQWPTSTNIGKVPETEQLKNKCLATSACVQREPILQLKKYSNLDKALRVTAYVLMAARRFMERRKQVTLRSNKQISVFLSSDNLTEALNYWILIEQTNMLPDYQVKYLKLAPQLVEVEVFSVKDDMIVVSGRVKGNLKIGYDKDYLPLLTHDSHLARLIMIKSHCFSHFGQDRTLQRSRLTAWISRGRNVAKSVCSNCFKCKLKNKKLSEQIMAPLPIERLPPTDPFRNTAIDLFGPIPIRDTVKLRVTKETWGVIFCCMTTSAIHLEVTESYSTDSFLLCLRKFFVTYPTPSYIQCDPGTQLVAAGKAVQKWDFTKIRNFNNARSIEWHVIPTASQHYNGCVESLIKSVKKQLVDVLSPSRLTKGELDTLFAEVAYKINSRPLMIRAGSDPWSDGPITPLHLLRARNTFEVPTTTFDENATIQKRLQFLEQTKQQFWNKWFCQVFAKLVPSQKWHHAKRDMQVGDIVLMKNSSKLQSEYKLGRVSEVFPGKDNRVRHVTVEYKNIQPGRDIKNLPFHKTERSIHNLAVIVPVDWSPDDIEKAVTLEAKTNKLFHHTHD